MKKGLVKQSFPFHEAYTGVDKTGKRCVGAAIIRKLKGLNLEKFPDFSLVRDMFLFSIYTRGMSFIDMVFLRKHDIRDGEISYIRKKTKCLMRVKVEEDIREILKKYYRLYPESGFVFPILRGEDRCENYREYQRALSRYNYGLKKLSAMIGVDRSLTSYVARHTWASMAYKMEIPVSVISCGMGHKTEAVTRIYLDSLENSVIDRANRRILRSLKN